MPPHGLSPADQFFSLAYNAKISQVNQARSGQQFLGSFQDKENLVLLSASGGYYALHLDLQGIAGGWIAQHKG